MNNLRKRRGAINVSVAFLDEHPEELVKAFSQIQFTPIHIAHRRDIKMVEYIGCSPFFREIPDMDKCMTYTILVDQINGVNRYSVAA